MRKDTIAVLDFCEKMNGRQIDTITAILVGAVACRVAKDDIVFFELLQHYFDEEKEQNE